MKEHWLESPAEGRLVSICHVKSEQKHMNCTFEFTLSVERARTAAATATLLEANRLVQTIEDLLSEFRSTSAVYALNRARPYERCDAPPWLLEALEACYALHLKTDGFFDPGIKGTRSFRQGFGWDADAKKLWRCSDSEHLSFAAFGKGFALDKVRLHLEQNGFFDYRLNAGGSSWIFAGWSAPQEPWRWMWAWSYDGDKLPVGIDIDLQSGHPICLGVSGTMEQGPHVSSRTSVAQPHHLISSIVTSRSAASSDALSTALLASGWDSAQRWLPDDDQAAAVTDGNSIHANARFRSLWERGQLVCLVMLIQCAAFAEQAIDLGDLGMDDFQPYMVHRDPIWILLPLAALALVGLHLKRTSLFRRKDR